ncbi:hypothetical protein JCM16303_005857 [Sporobolomyces ruberrimus]
MAPTSTTSSRIPTRSTKPSTSTTAPPANNENLPLASRSSLRPPSATTSKPSRETRASRSPSFTTTPVAIEISVQLPSSDGGGGGFARNDDDVNEQDAPLRNRSTSVVDDNGRESLNRVTSATKEKLPLKNSLLPVPTISTTSTSTTSTSTRRRRSSISRSRSKSRSKSPLDLPPSKPTYATLTSRRRSAAAALRRQQQQQETEEVQEGVTEEKKQKEMKKKGRGEGRQSKSQVLIEEGPTREGTRGEMGREETPQTVSQELVQEEQVRESTRGGDQAVVEEEEPVQEGYELEPEGEGFDWGGFEAEDVQQDYRGEEVELVEQERDEVRSEGNQTTLNQNEAVAVDFGSDDEEENECRQQMEEAETREAQEEGTTDEKEERQGSEEDRKDFPLLQDQLSSSPEPIPEAASGPVPDHDDDLPFADQPRYSPQRSTSREETPPLFGGLKEGQSYSQIFAPLSPNTTGEFDEVEPIRYGSFEPPEILVEEKQEEVEEEAPIPQVELESVTRSSLPPSPSIESPAQPEPIIDGEEEETTESLRPTPSRFRSQTPLSPAYLKFEHEVSLRASTPQGSSSSTLIPSTFLSPSSFLSRTFSRARTRSGTPIDHHQPQESNPIQIPQLEFVPLPSPRRLRLPTRSPSLAPPPTTNRVSRKPSPLSSAPAAAPAQEWTRGPAFFRSSSFSPPPVKSSFDRKGKGKASDQDQREEVEREEEEEESREYWKAGAMTVTSPHVSERGKSADLEEEEEVSRQGSIGGSRERGQGQSSIPPPTPSKDRRPLDQEQDDDDTSMRSLRGSLRSRKTSAASTSISSSSQSSPPRSPPPPPPTIELETFDDDDGDDRMISPSPSSSPVQSIRSIEMSISPAGSPTSQTSDKKLPATPPPQLNVEGEGDEHMSSPSPARTLPSPRNVDVSPVSSEGVKSLRRSPSRLEELVEAGRGKLTGLLSFGGIGAGLGTKKDVEGKESGSIPREAEASTSKTLLEDQAQTTSGIDSRQKEREEEEEDDQDQPFPLDSTRHSLAASTSTKPRQSQTTANESIFSNFSTYSHANSTSRRSLRARNHSHSSLPVIEISSTDAKAAARAAAILKVYHKYVEQGIEGGLARDEASRVIREAEKRGLEAEEEEDDEEEEELRTLLFDAEEEVRVTFGRGLSVDTQERSPNSRSPEEQAGSREEEEEADEEDEVRSVLLSDRSQSPATTQRALAPSVASTTESHSRSRSVSNESLSGFSSVVGERWTSQEWRRLEQSLVEAKRRLKGEGREIGTVEVVEAFLRRWGVSREECQGDWEWDKLLVRVEAIKARRAKDVREHRATSQVSALSVASSVQSRNSSVAADEGSSVGAVTEEEGERTVSPVRTVIKEEEQSDHGSDSGASSEEDEHDEDGTRDLQDDTFFASNRRLRRTRRTSMPHTRLPTALSNPRLAHIYDDAPAPEKPRLPIKELLQRGESTEPVPSVVVESDPESTPEPPNRDREDEEASRPASSAQRLFSYLGSFVRRSPGPSPTSSKFAPTSSISPSPEPETEMSETRLRPPPVVTPQPTSPSADETLPPVSNRKIRPLPHSQDQTTARTPVASTSHSSTSLDVPAPASRSIRRRRSSGEEGKVWEAVVAIEEAESSREEEEARVVELLKTGSAKRKASGGDLRRKVQRGDGKGKEKAKAKGKERAVELEGEEVGGEGPGR